MVRQALYLGVAEYVLTDILRRSYMEGLRRGYLTKDPSKFNDPDVCVPWVRTT